jgi:hypothetical protein
LLLRSGLLAVSHDESTIQEVIDLLRKRSATPTEPHAGEPSQAALQRQVRDWATPDVLAVLWLNPRAFDAEMQQKAGEAPASQAALQQALINYWRQISAVALTLHVDTGLEIRLHIRRKRGSGIKNQSGGLADLWFRFPEHAILSVAGRTDFAGLAAFIEAATPSEVRPQLKSSAATASQAFLGRDIVTDVLPSLGPNWGFCLAAPPTDRKGWFPELLFALQVRGKPGERPLEQAIFDAMRAGAGMVVLAHTAEGLGTQLKTEQHDKVALLSLLNPKIFPIGCQPAFAAKDGYTLWAANPDTIRRFPENAENGRADSGPSPDEVLRARFSFTEAVRFLRNEERRPSLVAALAQANQQPQADVEQQINKLVSVLELFQEAQLTVTDTSEEVLASIKLTFSQPLR